LNPFWQTFFHRLRVIMLVSNGSLTFANFARDFALS